MVKMAVGDQDTVQAAEPYACLQDLALGALSAVNQKPILILFYYLGG